MVVLADHTGHPNALTYRSSKPKTIVPVVVGGETYLSSAWFDATSTLQHELRQIFGYGSLIAILIVSQSIFNVVCYLGQSRNV